MPECRDLFAQVAHLYHELTAKALENEDNVQTSNCGEVTGEHQPQANAVAFAKRLY